MKKIVVYNKVDLANSRKTTEIIKQMEHDSNTVASFITSTKENVNISRLIKLITQNCPVQFRTVGVWIMIGGMPNLGKSTIINSLRSRDTELRSNKSTRHKGGAKTGARPCLTKSISGFKIVKDPPIYIVDTPGIIIPKLQDESEEALKLAACHAIRDGILDDELICDYVLYKLNKEKCF